MQFIQNCPLFSKNRKRKNPECDSPMRFIKIEPNEQIISSKYNISMISIH